MEWNGLGIMKSLKNGLKICMNRMRFVYRRKLNQSYSVILYARSKASTDNEWSAEADARCREMSAYLLALSDVGKITKYVYNVIYGTIYSSYHC